MDKMLIQSIDKPLVFYGVYYCQAEMWDGKDVFCLARKRFFESGTRQKKRSTLKTDIGTFNYSYTIENGANARYKKSIGVQVSERADETADGYAVEAFDSSRRLFRRAYYDRRHFWRSTEYYAPDGSVMLTLSPAEGDKPSLVLRSSSGERILFPFNISLDKETTDRLDIMVGEPEVFCVTNAGSFYFCTEEDLERRRSVLDSIMEEARLARVAERTVQSENTGIKSGFIVGDGEGSGGFDINASREIIVDKSAAAENTAAETVKPTEAAAVIATTDAAKPAEAEAVIATTDAAKPAEAETGIATTDTSKPTEADTHNMTAETVTLTAAAADNIITETAKPAKADTESITDDISGQPLSFDTSDEADRENKPLPSISDSILTHSPAESEVDDGDRSDFFRQLEDIAKQQIEKHKSEIPPVSMAAGQTDTASQSVVDPVGTEAFHVFMPETLPSFEDTSEEQKKTEALCAAGAECPFASRDMLDVTEEGQKAHYFGEAFLGKRSGRGITVFCSGSIYYSGEYRADKHDGFGISYDLTGEPDYAGRWNDGRRDGFGVAFSSDNGSIRAGRWRDDEPEGTAAEFDMSGRLLYAGAVKSGKRNGAGLTYCENDNTFFVGKYADGVFSGTGTQFGADGQLLYTGGYRDEMRCGEGVSYGADGSVIYRGEWSNNLYHGNGTLYRSDGTVLKGVFMRGKADGRGTLTGADGSKIYEGDFRAGHYDGIGRQFLPTGGYAEGRFTDDSPTGVFREYDKEDKLVYCGEWENGCRHGRGIAYINGEKCYEGEFADSLYNGEGKLFENGAPVYSGSFKNGVREGFGVEYRENRIHYKGLWKNGVYSGCGMLFRNGELEFAGQFENGLMSGRINEISGCAIKRRSIYSKGALTYTCEYSSNGALVYYGGMKDGMKNGMGCTLSETSEKLFEGMFRDGEPDKPMSVSLRELSDLPQCSELEKTEYALYRTAPEFMIDKTLSFSGRTGIYTGRLRNGLPSGRGTVLYSDHRYTGTFVDGEIDGEGIVYKNSGEELRGIFSMKPFADCRTLVFAEITYYYRELPGGIS